MQGRSPMGTPMPAQADPPTHWPRSWTKMHGCAMNASVTVMEAALAVTPAPPKMSVRMVAPTLEVTSTAPTASTCSRTTSPLACTFRLFTAKRPSRSEISPGFKGVGVESNGAMRTEPPFGLAMFRSMNACWNMLFVAPRPETTSGVVYGAASSWLILALTAALGSTIVRFAEAWQRHGNHSQYQEHRSLQLPGGDAVMLSCADLQALPELCGPGGTRLWQLTVGGV